jgi:hypothetical protein
MLTKTFHTGRAQASPCTASGANGCAAAVFDLQPEHPYDRGRQSQSGVHVAVLENY